jgi:hypothetical protein
VVHAVQPKTFSLSRRRALAQAASRGGRKWLPEIEVRQMKFIGEYAWMDLGKGPQQLRLGEQPKMDIAAGGIFGVGRLAAQLNKLLESGQIGIWHIGPWIDWHHKAIRIKFDSVEDGKLAEDVVHLAVEGAPS